MSYEEYAKADDRSGPLVIRGSKQSLYYFGERHSFDPADAQWGDVKGLWAEFLVDGSLKKVALVEGGVRHAAKTEAESIENDGGMGLVAFLAQKSGIPVESPEPDARSEREALEKEFSRDDIEYYYFARMALQWNRKTEPRPSFKEYMEISLRRDRHESGWEEYDFSLAHMYEIHKRIFGRELDPLDEDAFYDAANPTVLKNVSSRVSRRSGEIRDEHIALRIKKLWDDGYSVFAQFGHSHVTMQEPLLREILR